MREADLEQLYARLEKPIFNVVFRWVWKAEDAQEIVQEAFTRLWRMRDRVRLTTAEPLVYRIALNLARTAARRRKLWRWVSLEPLRHETAAGRGAEEALVDSEETARLRRAVHALPDDLRSVVMLSEFTELSYEQIAGVLAIPAGTVGSFGAGVRGARTVG